jgi:hypothetical protein
MSNIVRHDNHAEVESSDQARWTHCETCDCMRPLVHTCGDTGNGVSGYEAYQLATEHATVSKYIGLPVQRRWSFL